MFSCHDDKLFWVLETLPKYTFEKEMTVVKCYEKYVYTKFKRKNTWPMLVITL